MQTIIMTFNNFKQFELIQIVHFVVVDDFIQMHNK